MTATARVRKTPQEKAVEALRIANAEVERLEAKRVRLDTELGDVATELMAAVKRRDYLAQNPDLPKGRPVTSGNAATVEDLKVTSS